MNFTLNYHYFHLNNAVFICKLQQCINFLHCNFFVLFYPLSHYRQLAQHGQKSVKGSDREAACIGVRAPAPAGVNICFRNLNNRPAVICISDNGQPYGAVDPCCAKVFFPQYLSPVTFFSFSHTCLLTDVPSLCVLSYCTFYRFFLCLV